MGLHLGMMMTTRTTIKSVLRLQNCLVARLGSGSTMYICLLFNDSFFIIGIGYACLHTNLLLSVYLKSLLLIYKLHKSDRNHLVYLLRLNEATMAETKAMQIQKPN